MPSKSWGAVRVCVLVLAGYRAGTLKYRVAGSSSPFATFILSHARLTSSYIKVYALLTSSYIKVYAMFTSSYIKVYAMFTSSYIKVYAMLCYAQRGAEGLTPTFMHSACLLHAMDAVVVATGAIATLQRGDAVPSHASVKTLEQDLGAGPCTALYHHFSKS